MCAIVEIHSKYCTYVRQVPPLVAVDDHHRLFSTSLAELFLYLFMYSTISSQVNFKIHLFPPWPSWVFCIQEGSWLAGWLSCWLWSPAKSSARSALLERLTLTKVPADCLAVEKRSDSHHHHYFHRSSAAGWLVSEPVHWTTKNLPLSTLQMLAGGRNGQRVRFWFLTRAKSKTTTTTTVFFIDCGTLFLVSLFLFATCT